MPKVKYIRHVSIRSERLRALLHEAWKAGNDSVNLPHEPAGEQERREYITNTLVSSGYAFIVEDKDRNNVDRS